MKSDYIRMFTKSQKYFNLLGAIKFLSINDLYENKEEKNKDHHDYYSMSIRLVVFGKKMKRKNRVGVDERVKKIVISAKSES